MILLRSWRSLIASESGSRVDRVGCVDCVICEDRVDRE